ncbi:MAG: HD domain-containing protein [Pyrinomonadaceae bacterium]|nr:HD domain-containing protein [Pyrinomonadaceae bacterium]MBP6213189.1 HD domain-containing protein [Pyrinomonadaceae bacterium]
MNNVPQKVAELALAVREIGGRAMLVGGCVRDEIMGIAHKDWDVEVYGIEPGKLREILDTIGEVNVVGEAFAVYKIGNDLDVSIPRRERKVSGGHRGFVVEGDPEMSFDEACSRRDFTVNSILKDILTDEIIDPFGGQVDIKRKVLRMVSRDTFAEDSLRVLRAAQFAARFEFEIDAETVAVCQTIDVTDLPKERIRGELEKLLLKPLRPSIGLKWLYDLGVVRQLFPEMQSLVGVPQEPDWHPEGDVDVHTLMVVDEARKLIDELDHPRQFTVMLGALAHDFGKPPTTEFVDGRIRSRGHDEAGVEPTLSFLDTLGIHTLDGFDLRKQIVELVRYHLKPGEYYKAKSPVGDGAFRRLARKVEPDLLYRVAKADSLGRNPEWLPKEKWFGSEAQEWFIEKVRELSIEKKAPEPLLMGRHLIELGLSPSPRFRQILDAVYELQLDSKIATLDDALLEAKKMIA